MREAIRLSIENVDSRTGGPFGAVIVRDDEIIARGSNLVTTLSDPTAHAEMVAIREACMLLGDFQDLNHAKISYTPERLHQYQLQVWNWKEEFVAFVAQNHEGIMDYLSHACPSKMEKQEAAAAQQMEKELASIDSFYDLSAPDIDGNVVKFADFRGKVTIITNVASFCGYTASHYQGLVSLWSK